MRIISIAAAAFALGGLAAMAFGQGSQPVPFGHYYRLPPKVVKGHTVWPRLNDTADVSRLPDGNALVKIDLALDGAACSFTGVARFEGAELVYRDPQGDPNSGCMMAFSTEPGRLTWRDNGRCTARCPGGGTSGSLPIQHRGAPRPAARLQGYQAALAEWHRTVR